MMDMFSTKPINVQEYKSTNAKFKGVPPAIKPMSVKNVGLDFLSKMGSVPLSALLTIVMHVLMKINAKLVQ